MIRKVWAHSHSLECHRTLFRGEGSGDDSHHHMPVEVGHDELLTLACVHAQRGYCVCVRVCVCPLFFLGL